MLKANKVHPSEGLARLTSSATAFDRDYQELFSRYTEVTNGKQRIAECIATLTSETGRGSLLDLGAGDGALTVLLSKTFDRVVAIDKKEKYAERFGRHANVNFVHSELEAYEPDGRHNVVLFSYSLSGVAAEELRQVIDRMLSARSDVGKLLVVTYQDQCAWDRYTQEINSQLGESTIYSGVAFHTQQLEAAGYKTRNLANLATDIRGDDILDLYDRLGFFFLKHAREYFAKRDLFLPVLERYVESIDAEGVTLPVGEAIIEVIGRP